MAKDFLTAVKDRRSYYEIKKESSVSDERIQEIVELSLLHTPSAFHSQTAKAVVLFGKEHDKLWDIVAETLKKVVPAEAFAKTQEKLDGFKAGYMTILTFTDDAITKTLEENFPLYADNFGVWAEQACGMLQLSLWTALDAEGMGGSLQHYNPLIDAAVKKEWNVPDSWRLRGQQPFGVPYGEPGNKEFLPLSERLKIYRS
ncbi:MAG: nitroreductase family protein [Lachnospiraceae bacterium]